jgi:hypothetical protein
VREELKKKMYEKPESEIEWYTKLEWGVGYI